MCREFNPVQVEQAISSSCRVPTAENDVQALYTTGAADRRIDGSPGAPTAGVANRCAGDQCAVGTAQVKLDRAAGRATGDTQADGLDARTKVNLVPGQVVAFFGIAHALPTTTGVAAIFDAYARLTVEAFRLNLACGGHDGRRVRDGADLGARRAFTMPVHRCDHVIVSHAVGDRGIHVSWQSHIALDGGVRPAGDGSALNGIAGGVDRELPFQRRFLVAGRGGQRSGGAGYSRFALRPVPDKGGHRFGREGVLEGLPAPAHFEGLTARAAVAHHQGDLAIRVLEGHRVDAAGGQVAGRDAVGAGHDELADLSQRVIIVVVADCPAGLVDR